MFYRHGQCENVLKYECRALDGVCIVNCYKTVITCTHLLPLCEFFCTCHYETGGTVQLNCW